MGMQHHWERRSRAGLHHRYFHHRVGDEPDEHDDDEPGRHEYVDPAIDSMRPRCSRQHIRSSITPGKPSRNCRHESPRFWPRANGIINFGAKKSLSTWALLPLARMSPFHPLRTLAHRDDPDHTLGGKKSMPRRVGELTLQP